MGRCPSPERRLVPPGTFDSGCREHSQESVPLQLGAVTVTVTDTGGTGTLAEGVAL